MPPDRRNTTHDWTPGLDRGHLRQVRQDPAAFAPSGALHLVLEVLACAADEAEHTGQGQAFVTLHRPAGAFGPHLTVEITEEPG